MEYMPFNYSDSYEHPYNRSCCQSTNLNNTIEVNGKGSIMVTPDTALVSLGVITEDKDLKTAQQENALKMSKVIETLKNIGIAEKDIKTQSYNVEILYDYVEGKQIFKGYRVSNILRVTIRDIKTVGEVIDAAVDAGANTVSNVNFTVLNPSLYYRKALNIAINDAVEKAEVIENSLRVILNRTPIKITEETYGYAPVPTDGMLLKASATPLPPGQSEITANIKAVFNYKDI